jgi:pyridoxal phosphate enzyme (YggS family)
MSISDNIMSVKNNIRSACIRAGREPEDVKLVAVSKTMGTDKIMEAVNSGINVFGENKVQELVSKYEALDKGLEWHMIGHLQSNKVKYIIDKVAMIHSVDSIKLLQEIDRRCKAYGKRIDVLIEINIGREATKYGIYPEDLGAFLEEAPKYENVRICGLMTVAPKVNVPEDARPYFKEMKKLFDDAKSSNSENVEMKYLSMGMTGDYEVAIEEGSNIVRIGTGIFGPRNYRF